VEHGIDPGTIAAAREDSDAFVHCLNRSTIKASEPSHIEPIKTACSASRRESEMVAVRLQPTVREQKENDRRVATQGFGRSHPRIFRSKRHRYATVLFSEQTVG
jgi:hypothetical protein